MRKTIHYLSFSILLTLAAWNYKALGQSVSTGGTQVADGGLEEIVVTAERRTESIQKVPLSMTAITGATLENLGMNSFQDFAGTIPNLSIGVGGGQGGNGNGFGISSSRNVTIRGVSGVNTTGFYLNDTLVPMSLDPRILDIDHVEVLRGPQGTLFGGGSMGGTVRIIARDPSLDTTTIKVDTEGSYVNDGGPGYSFSGTLNVPLIENVAALRTSVFNAFTPGWFTRVWGVDTEPGVALPPGAPTGDKPHVGDNLESGAAISLKITPPNLPGLAITPMFMYQKSTSNGYPTADYSPDNLRQIRPLDVPESVQDTWMFGGLTAKYDTDLGHLIASGTYFWRDAFDQEDGTQIVANPAVNGLPNALAYFVAAPDPNHLYYKTWTEEARFESTLQGPVQFVVGVFSSLQERRYVVDWIVPGINAASGNVLGTDNMFQENAPNADRERAVFADVSYDATSKLQLSAGVRRAYLAYEFTNVTGGYYSGGVSTSSGEHAQNNTSPRFTAKYQLTPSDMVYVSAAKGFRVGGTNFKLPSQCDANIAEIGVQNGAPFNSDSLWSFELGSKNSWFDNRINTRVAAFRIDWKNIQSTTFLPCTYDITTNSGAAEIKGGEMEIDASVTNHLKLSLNVGYTDATITQTAPDSIAVLGQPLNEVPRWTGSAIVQYDQPIAIGKFFVRGVETSVSSMTSFNNAAYPGLPIGGYGLLNLRSGIDRGQWEYTVFVDNALDRRATLGDIVAETAQIPGRPRYRIVQPRTIGLGLKWNY